MSIFSPSDTVYTPSDVNVFEGLSSTAQDKATLLQERKQEKEKRLNPRANLEDSYTQLEDGSLESNKNKVWNSLSDPEYQNMYSQVMRDYTLVKGEDGKTRFAATGEEYSGPTSWFYQGTAKEGDAYKLGISRGDKHYTDRYTPNGLQGKQAYGWESGPEGINPETMGGVLLPQNAAVTLEGITHGREAAFRNRVAMSGDQDAKTRLGGGYTEYYKGPQGALGNTGQEANVSDQAMLEQWRQYLGQTQMQNPRGGIADKALYKKQLEEQRQAREADNMGVVGRLGNTLAGFGKSFVQNLALDTADWAGETLKRQTGWGWDLGTEEEKADMASKVFGYNQVLAERGQQEASKYVKSMWEAATKEDVDFKVSDAWNLFKTVMTTPEMIGESVGYVAAMLPGVWGKAAKTASGLAKELSTLDKVTDAARIAEITPVLQAAQKQAAMGKTIGALGLVNVATGDVNDQIDQYMKNNEGVAPSAGDIMFRMMPIAVAATAIDKFSMAYTVGAAKSVAGVAKEATTELVETLPAAAKNQLWGKVGTAALDISKAAGVEAAQEYTQTMAEIFNKQYDTEKYGDDVSDILTSDENIVEALTASAFGAGQGAQMKAASPLWDATKAGAAAIGSGIAAAGDAITKGKEALDDLKDDVKTVDVDGRRVTAEELDKELDGVLGNEGITPSSTKKPTIDASNMSMEDILGSLGMSQSAMKKNFGVGDGIDAAAGTTTAVDDVDSVVKSIFDKSNKPNASTTDEEFMDNIKGAINSLKTAATKMQAEGKSEAEIEEALTGGPSGLEGNFKVNGTSGALKDDVVRASVVDYVLGRSKKVDTMSNGFGDTSGSFGTSIEAMRVIENYLEKVVQEGKVSPEYVDSLHKLLVERSSGDQISDTMRKVVEVKEAAKKLNEAYKVIIEDASEGSVQSGTGKSNKTMSEVTREVADDVQKWFNVAIKADSVINSSASAESKRVALKHKDAIAGHLQRLTSSQKSKRDQIVNAEEDAINTINQMVLAQVGNDVEKAKNRAERQRALVILKDELQKLYATNTKNKSQTDLANQHNPIKKGYVVVRYGTGNKGSFIIPLHMVVEKLYAEEFSNADGSYSIKDTYTVPVTSKNHVLTGSTQYTGVLRSVDTEIKALETISRYVAGSPILTREERNDIAKAEKQEQEELVATPVVDDAVVVDNEYADLERMADAVSDQEILFYDDSAEYLRNNPEIFENVVEDTTTTAEDTESAVTEVEDTVEDNPVVVEDVLTDDFTVDDIPDISTSLEELVELKDSIDSKEVVVPEEEVESDTVEDVNVEVKRRLVQILTNTGVGYQNKVQKAKDIVNSSLSNLNLFESTTDKQVMEILHRSKEEVVALYRQYKEELETTKPKKPVTAKQAASRNVAAALKDLREELVGVKADITNANKDIRNLRAESRKQGWTSLWPFGNKEAIELEGGYYATKTGGITKINNGRNNLEGRGYKITIDLSTEGAAYKFLEQFGLNDKVISGNMKPRDMQSSGQKMLENDIKDLENYLEGSRLLERKEELETKIKEIKETRRRALATGKYEQLVFDFNGTRPEEPTPNPTTEPIKPTHKDKVSEAKKLMVSKQDWVEDLFKQLSEVSIDSKEGFNIVYNKLHSLLTVMTDVKDEKEKSIIMALQDKLVQLKDNCK